MDRNTGFSYPSLRNKSQIRLILLAPGNYHDPINCSHLTIDLDADWRLPKRVEHDGYPLDDEQVDNESSSAQLAGKTFQTQESLDLQLRFKEGGGLYPFQRYAALSYVWGDQSNAHKIFLNGDAFYVGDNLYRALRRLRKHTRIFNVEDISPPQQDIAASMHHIQLGIRLLWVDSICINQANVSEREAQVKLMSRIYKQADHVHADLGHYDRSDSYDLISVIKSIMRAGKACLSAEESVNPSQSQEDTSAMVHATQSELGTFGFENSGGSQTLNPPSSRGRSLEDQGIPPKHSPVWKLWNKFMNSPYFNRVWIIQEFLLPKQVILWFGEVGLQAEQILLSVLHISEYSTQPSLYFVPRHHQPSAWGVQGLIHQRSLIHHPKYRENFASQNNLLQKLHHARHTNATDLRDKVFGVLGLADDGPTFYHLVSYTKAVEEVYWDYARCFIEKGQGIEMLYQIDSRSSRTLDIPTWVPDWSRAMDESSLFAYLRFDFNSAPKPEPQSLRQRGLKLSAKGQLIDAVDCLSTPAPHGFLVPDRQDIRTFLGEGSNMLLKLGFAKEKISSVLSNTLLCIPLGSKRPVELDRIQQCVDAMQGLILSLQAGTPYDDATWDTHARYFFHFGLSFARGRRWCLTKRGKFGLLPGMTKDSDYICALGNGPLPFVLRPLSQRENTKYSLIGHGYLHNSEREMKEARYSWYRLTPPDPPTARAYTGRSFILV